MFAPALLVAVAFAPPEPGPPAGGGDAGDPWAGRSGPTLTVENFEETLRLHPNGPLAVGVRIDPYVPTQADLAFYREVRPRRGDGVDGEPRPTLLRQVIGAEAFPVRPPAGSMRTAAAGDLRDPAGRPGYVTFMLLPPAEGWPVGRGEVRVGLREFPDAKVVAPVLTARPLDPEILVLFWLGLKPPSWRTGDEPAERPDRGFALDLNAAATAAAADPDAVAARLRPWERFEIRGTFRGPPPEGGVAYGPEVSATLKWPGGFAFAGTTRSFAEGPPAADGTVLYWFRETLELPGGAGDYRLRLEPGPFAPPEAPGPNFPVLTLRAGDEPAAGR